MSLAFLRDRRGIALITTLLVSFAVSAIALAAVMMTLNATLVGKNSERASTVDAAALSGLEEARSRVNGNRALYPVSGYTTLESNVPVKDANNVVIPNLTRSTYVGPSGITTGQYGIVGSIISLTRDAFNNKVVRRLEINQESFSKFSYMTDIEKDTLGTVLSFLNNDQVRGPVHTNDTIRIASTGATFYDQVTSAVSSMIGQSYGTFAKPPQLSVARIPMPTVADLNRLDSLAQVGNSRFTGSTAGDGGEARTRIQFLTIDVGVANGGVQGFFRVYQGLDETFVSASLPITSTVTGGYLELSRNCGDSTGIVAPIFLAAQYHDTTSSVAHKHGIIGTTNANKIARRDASLTPAAGLTTRCYLGGDSVLTKPGAGANWLIAANQPDGGAWVQAPSSIQTSLAALGTVITNRPDRNYLFPLSRAWNPNFKGVIYVAGKVILDGVIHGRVTVAASGSIIFGDDVTYYQNPATRDCTSGDIAGYFSGQSIIVSNNTMNASQTLNTDGSQIASPAGTFRSYSLTKDETIHGFFLTLKTFGAESYGVGSNNAEVCSTGGTSTVGRGCLNTYGGLIQKNRGAVTQTVAGGGTGYAKRYQYDACGATDPPPYFPTTGFFVKNRFYEMDPTRFNVAGWYAANQN
jgi:Tfp pilus assembly protein PilX